jgi:hypothetical protein
MREFISNLGIQFGLDFNFEIFLDLNYDVMIHSLSLIERSILVKLKDNSYLGFVSHWEDKGLVDVLVVDVVAVGGAMHSEVLLIKVNGVFAPGNCQVHVD